MSDTPNTSNEPEAAEAVPAEIVSSKEGGKDRTWCMLSHLSALSMLLGIPFGHILGPLLIWLLKKDEFPSVDRHGRDAMNFQISMTIYSMIAGLLVVIAIGIPLLFAVVLTDIVCVIIASIKASEGSAFKYPFTIVFIK